MRVWCSIPLLCLLGFFSLSGGAAVAADTSPTCAEGPTRVGDTTYGTPCGDVIVAPAGVAAVEGGGGDDMIVPGPIAAATASCPSGCHLGIGSQTFEGGDGDDVVYGERGNDRLLGGPGNDHLFGGIGDDLLLGGLGNDRLAGGFGADSINGEEGDDYVRGDSTIDRIFDTGGSFDTLSYSTGITPGFGGSVPYANFPEPGRERGVRLELGKPGQNANNGVAPDGGGVDEVEVGAFETFIGTAFSDYILGTGATETIYGGGGADAMVGGGGGDTLVGGAEGDYADGGTVSTRDTGRVSVGFMTPAGATPYAQVYLVGSEGDDNLTATYTPAAVTFQLAAGTTFDQSAAGAGGCDVKTATEAVCGLFAPLDSLFLAGMGGADTLVATGFPFAAAVVAIGGVGGDSITGGETEDILVDGPEGGPDVLDARGGDDALTHNNAADQLLGGDGNDLFLSNSVCDDERIVGGLGRDNASWARIGEGVHANLASGTAGRPGSGEAPACGAEPPDSLAEIEDLEGSGSGDVFYGDAGPNQLLGHPGPDVYFAGAGEDLILANSGDADLTINCGADADRALFDHPQYGDPPPVECEATAPSDPNNFRTPTQLPPPPLEEPPPAEESPPSEQQPPDEEPGSAGGSGPGTLKPPTKPDSPVTDRISPRTMLLGRPPTSVFAPRARRRVAFRFASNEAGSHFRCKLDRKPYRSCTSPRTYLVAVGRHAFRVFAVDAAGNRDRTPALLRFRVRAR